MSAGVPPVDAVLDETAEAMRAAETRVIAQYVGMPQATLEVGHNV